MLFTFFTHLQMLLCGSNLKFHLQQVISNSIRLGTGDWLRHCITALIWLQTLLSWFWVSKYFAAFMWIWAVRTELFTSEWIQLLLSVRTVSLHHTALAVFYTGCCVLGMVFTVFTYLILIKADLSFGWFGKIQSGLSIFETDQYFTHHFCVFSHKVLVLWLNWKRNTNLLSWIVKGLFAMEKPLHSRHPGLFMLMNSFFSLGMSQTVDLASP